MQNTIEKTETEKIHDAAIEFINRRDRRTHPAGTFDNGGRFYLADEEKCACCESIRNPSRAYPWSEMAHGRTLKHVAHLFGVDEKSVRAEVKKIG